ncbi:MAG TPA: hypothetical protein VET48_00370 [Steroidobacteraceae bacterium]|nr:hypothetical protein [Steroidobacteraceae bacterium]
MSSISMVAAYGMTNRISSRATRFYKRSFSILWFGIAVAVLAVGVAIRLSTNLPLRTLPVFIILPCVFTFVGVLMRWLFRDLVDEVYDEGDHLLIKNREEQEQIPLTGIMNVSATTLTNPPRVTLRLAKSGRFGDEVSFIPVRTSMFKTFQGNPIIDDLIVRVDRARARRVV